jgi:hypothetical protein
VRGGPEARRKREWGPIETRLDFVSCVQGEDDVGDSNAMLRLEMWSEVHRRT